MLTLSSTQKASLTGLASAAAAAGGGAPLGAETDCFLAPSSPPGGVRRPVHTYKVLCAGQYCRHRNTRFVGLARMMSSGSAANDNLNGKYKLVLEIYTSTLIWFACEKRLPIIDPI